MRREELALIHHSTPPVEAALGRSKHLAQTVRRLTEISAEHAGSQADALAAGLQRSFALLVILGIIAVVVAPLVFRLFIQQDVIREIKRMTHAMRQLGGGRLDQDIVGADRQDELGDMARALVVFKSNARQLQISLDKERELNGLQRQFVSMVSHEFRTPLAIIDGNAQRLLRKRDAVPADLLHQGLSKIRLSVRRLTELMESVLNAARLEEGRIKFEPGECDLAGVVREVCSNHAEISSRHQIIVDAVELPQRIIGDEKLLRQVISNLVSNAVKYSPVGGHVWVTGGTTEAGEVVIAVRDEGVGIPPDEQQRLFERFYRASTSIGIAGSGIGLHLAQHLAALHEGKIEFDSVESQGTTFRLRLPVMRRQDQQAARLQLPDDPAAGLRSAVAEAAV
jgi:signal transduction histidine kinase